MTKEEIDIELQWFYPLTRVTDQDKKRMLIIHRELFGAAMDFCLTCPHQIRLASDRLKRYYEKDK